MKLAVAVLAATLLAGCADDASQPPPVAQAPLDFGYLTKLRLNVGTVSVDDSYVPQGPGEHVEGLVSPSPADLLRLMARERVLPGGSTGTARVTIQDASILQGPDRLDGSLALRLDVTSGDGSRTGFAEARVARSQSLGDADARATADKLVRRMTADMNVEFEYQVRRALHDQLQTTATAAPEGPPVQQQDLPPPVPGS